MALTSLPQSPPQVVRVALVDDDAFVLTALRAYLASSERIEVASTFNRAVDALAFLRRVPVDVLLTDVRMPGMDGLELLSRVRAEHPGIAVVVLTSFDDDEAMLAALSQSANGFLLKDSAPEEIVRAVLAAGSGDDPAEIPADAIAPVARSLVFTHSGPAGESFELPLGSQSDGTVAWLAAAAPAVDVLRRGGLLVVDELDASLHPALSSALVTMFKDRDVNPRGAQLLFSSHDTALLGNAPSRLLGRDEVWFCEKDDAGASELVPLSAYATRRGDNEQKRYLTGRFGALPRVDLSGLLGIVSDPDGAE